MGDEEQGLKHVVNLSGGACSFWAAHRVVEKYGTADVVLLFADTLIEDPDLYELNARTAEYFGIPITRVSREIKPWDLFRSEGLIANNRAPICSIMLKREPLDEWFRQNMTPVGSLFGEADIRYVGLDWTEINRLNDLRASKPEWLWEAPMCEWDPPWDKCKMTTELESVLGFVPRAYKENFPHNNCGRRCVRAGITHFVHLWNVDQPAFLDWEHEEQRTIREFDERGIEWKSVLKDRRGGVTKSLTFAQLRERILVGDKTLPKDD